MTSEKLEKSNELTETFKDSTINDAEYYASDSVNANNENGDTEINPKTVTHTSDRKKIKVIDTSNIIMQQKLLSNRTLLVVTTTMYPRIDDMIATCGGTYNTIATPEVKEVITDVVCISACGKRTPRHVSPTGRDGSTPGNTYISVSPTRANYPVLIVGTNVSPACGISGRVQVGNKQQPNPTEKTRNAKKLDTSVDRKFPDDQDSASIFSKVNGCELSHGSSADLY